MGLEAAFAKLLHVAEAGSFGGGMLSYLAISSGSFSGASDGAGSLRFRLSLRLNAEAENGDSVSVGDVATSSSF